MGRLTHTICAACLEKCGGAGRSPPLAQRRGIGSATGADRGADVAEVALRLARQEVHSNDASNCDEGNEEGILHQGGAPLGVGEPSPHPGGEYVKRCLEVHDSLRGFWFGVGIRTCLSCAEQMIGTAAQPLYG